MANELGLKIKWENGVNFKMTSKLDAEEVKTVVEADENGHIAETWPHLENVCTAFFFSKMAEIGAAMKAE